MSLERNGDNTPGRPVRGATPGSGQASNLFRQRRAVAALKERQKVLLASSTYAGGTLRSARVIVGDRYYDVRPGELAFLRDGRTPQDLGLEPAEDKGGE
jgi:hypothetical protein